MTMLANPADEDVRADFLVALIFGRHSELRAAVWDGLVLYIERDDRRRVTILDLAPTKLQLDLFEFQGFLLHRRLEPKTWFR